VVTVGANAGAVLPTPGNFDSPSALRAELRASCACAGIWDALIENAGVVAPRGRDRIRLANLAIAAQVTAETGKQAARRMLNGKDLASVVHDLSLSPIQVDASERAAWARLADLSRQAAHAFGREDGIDAWVRAFQAADAARKSRGAYATPRELAESMARLLLAGQRIPRRVIDPAAGAGSLLIAVFRQLQKLEPTKSSATLARKLYGVELDPVARELCCLLLWLVSDQQLRLHELEEQIILDNAITRDWWSEDPFEALIMNPPWDSLRHQPEADSASLQRDATLERIAKSVPAARDLPSLYSAHGSGDHNLYKAFVELAPHLVVPAGGRVVALLPGAWSSDLGTRELRRMYLEDTAVEQWTSFENLRGYFPIDGRYKFGLLVATRNSKGTEILPTRAFATEARESFGRHIRVTRQELSEVGGPASIIPDITSAAELRLMLKFRRNGAPFFSGEGPFGTVDYIREVDLTLDKRRGLFWRRENLDVTPLGDGTWTTDDGRDLVPLIEGRMVGQYDFHQKSWHSGSGRTAKWTYANGASLSACSPQYLVAASANCQHRVAICDVTSATNTRTVLATWVPPAWRCGNTAPTLVFASERMALAGLAVLNSMVFDWYARRVVAGLHLNRFYLAALSWPALDQDEIDLVAAAAAALQKLTPRYRDLRGPKIRHRAPAVSYVDAHASIEAVVACGYGLTATDLKTVYSRAVSDRRGFWRHFASDPHAGEIVNSVVRAYEPRASELAGKTASPARVDPQPAEDPAAQSESQMCLFA
jgi:hypothetical protein